MTVSSAGLRYLTYPVLVFAFACSSLSCVVVALFLCIFLSPLCCMGIARSRVVGCTFFFLAVLLLGSPSATTIGSPLMPRLLFPRLGSFLMGLLLLSRRVRRFGDVDALLLREVLQESIYIRYGAARFREGGAPSSGQCPTKGEVVRCVKAAERNFSCGAASEQWRIELSEKS